MRSAFLPEPDFVPAWVHFGGSGVLQTSDGSALQSRLILNKPAWASNGSLVPDADFVFIHDGRTPGYVDVLEIEQRSSNCLTDSLLGGWMDLQPNHPERLRGWESHHVREIGVQRYEDAAVLNSKAQDLFVSRS